MGITVHSGSWGGYREQQQGGGRCPHLRMHQNRGNRSLQWARVWCESDAETVGTTQDETNRGARERRPAWRLSCCHLKTERHARCSQGEPQSRVSTQDGPGVDPQGAAGAPRGLRGLLGGCSPQRLLGSPSGESPWERQGVPGCSRALSRHTHYSQLRSRTTSCDNRHFHIRTHFTEQIVNTRLSMLRHRTPCDNFSVHQRRKRPV